MKSSSRSLVKRVKRRFDPISDLRGYTMTLDTKRGEEAINKPANRAVRISRVIIKNSLILSKIMLCIAEFNVNLQPEILDEQRLL